MFMLLNEKGSVCIAAWLCLRYRPRDRRGTKGDDDEFIKLRAPTVQHMHKVDKLPFIKRVNTYFKIIAMAFVDVLLELAPLCPT